MTGGDRFNYFNNEDLGMPSGRSTIHRSPGWEVEQCVAGEARGYAIRPKLTIQQFLDGTVPTDWEIPYSLLPHGGGILNGCY